MTAERHRFLPVRRQKLLELIQADPVLVGDDAEGFGRFSRVLAALFHHDLHRMQERLKEAYARFDQEVSERWGRASDADRSRSAEELADCLDQLLKRANYVRLSPQEIHAAAGVQSIFNIGVRVRFDDFDEFVVYRRGLTEVRETLPSWFGLRRRTVVVPGFDRVCLFVRFKDAAHFQAQGRKNLPFRPGTIYLKLFRRIPRQDLEMLFPNAEVRMRLRDGLVIGGLALAGFLQFLFKIGPALTILVLAVAFYVGLSSRQPESQDALLGAVITLGVIVAYLGRQWSKYRNRKLYFLKILNETLYYRNLDNGAGVFLHLMDGAEEAEVKEAMLAYAFLHRRSDGLAPDELDRRIEDWLKRTLNTDVDFDHEDALEKLQRLGLVEVDGGRLQACPLGAALERLDQRWDDLFDRNGQARDLSPEAPAAGA